MNTIRLITATFDAKISFAEISYFRGNMIRLSGNDPLFHNHHTEGLCYAYPLIQYKRIDGHAALIGINQGAEALVRILGKEEYLFQLGNRSADMGAVMIRSEKFPITCDNNSYIYSISNWLPLNGENYRMYLQTEAMIERIAMLEKILLGNILSFAKGVGVFFDSPVTCRILQLESSGLVSYKEVQLMSFSAKFQCNVHLPEYIGLGKSVSVNHGVVSYIKMNNRIMK